MPYIARRVNSATNLFLNTDSQTANKSTLSERLIHPRTLGEFMEALHVFTTLCTA